MAHQDEEMAWTTQQKEIENEAFTNVETEVKYGSKDSETVDHKSTNDSQDGEEFCFEETVQRPRETENGDFVIDNGSRRNHLHAEYEKDQKASKPCFPRPLVIRRNFRPSITSFNTEITNRGGEQVKVGPVTPVDQPKSTRGGNDFDIGQNESTSTEQLVDSILSKERDTIKQVPRGTCSFKPEDAKI